MALIRGVLGMYAKSSKLISVRAVGPSRSGEDFQGVAESVEFGVGEAPVPKLSGRAAAWSILMCVPELF